MKLTQRRPQSLSIMATLLQLPREIRYLIYEFLTLDENNKARDLGKSTDYLAGEKPISIEVGPLRGKIFASETAIGLRVSSTMAAVHPQLLLDFVKRRSDIGKIRKAVIKKGRCTMMLNTTDVWMLEEMLKPDPRHWEFL